MIIRPAQISDAERVLAFLQEFRAEGLETVLQHPHLPNIEEEEAFIARLDGITGIMLIALKDERVVGCLTAEVASHSQLRHACEFGMGVLKGQRAGGIGTALMEPLIEWARSAGLRRIQLSVFARNAGAIRLYHRLGFAVETTKKGAIRIGDQYEDLVEMARNI